MSMSGETKVMSSDEMLKKIFETMTALFEEREFSKSIQLLTELGRVISCAERTSFWCWDKKQHTIWTISAQEVNGRLSIPENTGLVGAAILNNESEIINDPYHDSRFNSSVDKKTGFLTKSLLTLPVTDSNGDVIGAYQAVNKISEDGSGFEKADLMRLKMVAAFCAKTLESHKLNDEATTDQLTGLKNRRGFYWYYDKFINPLLQDGIPCSFVIGDIDFFKKFNDTYGHNAGDAVLKHVAMTLRENARIDDGVFRWGGEEFILLLPKTDIERGVEMAERIRKSIEESVCHFKEESLELRVTMSFGAVQLSADKSIDENVKAGDSNLYSAKESGRNRVVS